MLNIKQMHSNFVKEGSVIEVILISKLIKYTKRKSNMFDLLLQHANLLRSKSIEINEFNNLGYTLPINYFENKINVLSGVTEKTHSLILDYYNNFIRYANRIIIINRQIELNRLNDIHITTYHDIIKFLNIEITRLILQGKTYTFSNGVSSIFVNRFPREASHKKSVDNRASLDVLEAICKEKDIDLYNKYKSKEILKRDFIVAMKKYTYSKENPTFDKWLTYYTDDIFHMIVWIKGNCVLKNKSVFSFVPSNYIHTPTRSQIDFVKNVKSVDEIIDSICIGLRDKLNILLRYDKSASMNFKKLDHELQNS